MEYPRFGLTMRRIVSLVTLALIGIASLIGCSSGSSGDAKSGSTANAKPAALRIALVPSDDTEQMMSGFEPLRAYLEKTLGMPVEVRKVTNYGAVIEAMRKNRVDLAWYGPTAYILAEKEADAEAFMVSVDKKGVTTYQSYILVPGNSPAKSIKDLAGKEVALVQAASTSGGLIPSYMILTETGQEAAKFCHINYVGNHDAVVNVVKNASVAAGATNNLTVDRMVEQGKVKPSDFRILKKSDPIPGSPLAWRKSLDPALKEKIVAAILGSPKALGTYSIAGFGEIASFQRTTPASYQIIRDLVDKLALKREDLLK
jgi:phosphonate transport system substrate-binding protein